jgi:cell division protein FtsL
MTVLTVLAAVSAAVVAVVRYLRATRALRTAEQKLDRERDHLNRTWNYQTGRVLR